MAEARLHRLRSPGFYVGSGIFMLLLTLLAFVLVGKHVLTATLVIPILLLLALIQVAMQLWLFMHLESGRRVFQLFFLFGIGVALIVSWAIWYLTLQSA
jgi:cytochrome c oxidase subunit 4